MFDVDAPNATWRSVTQDAGEAPGQQISVTGLPAIDIPGGGCRGRVCPRLTL